MCADAGRSVTRFGLALHAFLFLCITSLSSVAGTRGKGRNGTRSCSNVTSGFHPLRGIKLTSVIKDIRPHVGFPAMDRPRATALIQSKNSAVGVEIQANGAELHLAKGTKLSIVSRKELNTADQTESASEANELFIALPGDTVVAASASSSLSRPICAANAFQVEPIGCRLYCECDWYQMCYTKTITDQLGNFTDVGVCALSEMASVVLSIALIGTVGIAFFCVRVELLRREWRLEEPDAVEAVSEEEDCAPEEDHPASDTSGTRRPSRAEAPAAAADILAGAAEQPPPPTV
eukprot:CAMPEP_0115330226 /NCGR_PEP_ID=MMETSP0270-20121206/85665_1 /TAXON_ID=71861 /ORGANISM="Scrippsiella trochoidea, Strain CCMP3099" /LENGTH=291 /DNA_ID=CAMNT_0002750929 /DNA_START=1 /DNA_END=872 /DNA_ORIENTATION=+